MVFQDLVRYCASFELHRPKLLAERIKCGSFGS